MIIENFSKAKELLLTYVPTSGLNARPYSLDNMFSIMNFLGNPQNKFKTIHVAGTSGKTSTAYYAAGLLSTTGRKVGLTISPHISEINERLQINMVPLAEAEYCRELGEFIDLINDSGIKVSYFELLVAFAFWEFSKQKVDYAVVEVGLGGLLDATNVVDRVDKVCIITDIGLDHMKVLGSTLAKIAFQKAGIIKENNTVFAFDQSDEVNRVIEAQADKHQAELIKLNPTKDVSQKSFLPTFQRRNFSLALAAANYIIQRDKLVLPKPEQVNRVAHILIPARMEEFERSGKVIIIDGAHNAQKIKALVEAIKDRYPDSAVAAIVSFVSGGEERIQSSLEELNKLSKEVIITTFAGQQDTPKHSINPKEILKAAQKLNMNAKIINDPVTALSELEKRPEPVLLITGSFYLLNHIRPLML